jgi:GTP-binding protein
MNVQKIRNLAMVAHVDHGKTTFMDAILNFCGAVRTSSDRMMDSMTLEKERGITIRAKHAGVVYEGYQINLIDTPGHADFGAEVERSLYQVDSLILLVDSAEGPLPQTRFILKKALEKNKNVMVVINKVDRPDARIEEVESLVEELFLDLAKDETQLQYPVFYASGRQGWISKNKNDREGDLSPLLKAVIETCPAPQAEEKGAFSFQVNELIPNDYFSVVTLGKCFRGQCQVNDQVILNSQNQEISVTIKKIWGYEGLDLVEKSSLESGQIGVLAFNSQVFPTVSDTICAPGEIELLPPIEIDPPYVSVIVRPNSSPLANRDGRYWTIRQLESFFSEKAKYDLALSCSRLDNRDALNVQARGELQISLLLEELRRSGGECIVGRPQVVPRQNASGAWEEPVERLTLHVPKQATGTIIQSLGERGGQLKKMAQESDTYDELEVDITTRNLLGFRRTYTIECRGEGLISSEIISYQPVQEGEEPHSRIQGALVSDRAGDSTEYALYSLEDRGRLFLGAGNPLYKGLIVGEHNRPNDLWVNACRAKKLTNMRSSGTDEATKLSKIQDLTLEDALDWINNDEGIEVTPKRITLFKLES